MFLLVVSRFFIEIKFVYSLNIEKLIANQCVSQNFEQIVTDFILNILRR